VRDYPWRAWIEVDLDALWANYLLLKARAQGEVIPVLKADAYGHGALPIARFLEERGVGRFAVATIACLLYTSPSPRD